MLYHYFKDNTKVYTLNNTEREVEQSHPAHFTPLDKYSKYRVELKKRYNIAPFNDLNK